MRATRAHQHAHARARRSNIIHIRKFPTSAHITISFMLSASTKQIEHACRKRASPTCNAQVHNERCVYLHPCLCLSNPELSGPLPLLQQLGSSKLFATVKPPAESQVLAPCGSQACAKPGRMRGGIRSFASDSQISSRWQAFVLHVCMYIYIYVFIHTYVCVYTYIYIYII